MAIFDPERGAVVVRIVYDGPPLAGKTTSVRSLGRSLRRSVETPLEAAGRTLLFDWMEYTGGLFEGHQIRCQIVSVPGQPNLAPRRKAILLGADAVVFVADTGDPRAVERSREYVTGLARLIRAEVHPPIGIVVQANKRDLPDAVPTPTLRERLGDAVAGVGITESVASEGTGVRETFVFAVRLALDRVRDLTARGALPQGKPSVDSAEELLAALEAYGSRSIPPSDVDGPRISSTAAPADSASSPTKGPLLPDARVPSGAIWPPIDGRLVLHEATTFEQRARRVDSGDWVAGIGTGWRIHSPASAAYAQIEDGRRALVQWARVHATLGSALSPNRCIVLAEAGDGGWRLWQIVKITTSVRERLNELSQGAPVQALLEGLWSGARALADALRNGRGHGLRASLDTIDTNERGSQFVGLMPPPSAFERVPRDEEDGDRLIIDQIEALVRRDWPDRIDDIRAALRRGAAPSLSDAWAAPLTSRLLDASHLPV